MDKVGNLVRLREKPDGMEDFSLLEWFLITAEIEGTPRRFQVKRIGGLQFFVEELEKAYLKMRPLMHTHPKLSALIPSACDKCGGKLIRRGTQTISGGKLKQRVQCKSCGGWDSVKI